MNASQTRIITLYSWSILLLCLIFFGCANSPVSSVHNIRQIENNAGSQNGKEFTLMTYNIRAGGGKKEPGLSPRYVRATKKNLNKIAEAIKYIDPDFIGLQEVRGGHQARYIAEQLNLNYAYITHGGRSNWWGLAILSKYEISEMRTRKIWYGSDEKNAQLCTIKLDGRPVTIINVHVSPSHLPTVNSSYKEQFDLIEKIINNLEGPVVLMGDFNRVIGSVELSSILEILSDTCDAVDTESSKAAKWYGTFGKNAIGSRIDGILITPKDFEVIDAGTVLEAIDASDHLAYWTKLELKE
jgi:endonuclease/exonuclease/phosphatase family metal-dependent hydrolase